MKIVDEFKQFILRGNVLDMAVGVIVGGAFNNIVNSMVKDMLMPVLSLITGKIDFTNLFIPLDGSGFGAYSTLQSALDAGVPVFAFGSFIQNVIQFLIMAFAIFLLVKGINKLHRPAKTAEPVPATKICTYCKSEIHIEAVKCPHCASDLELITPDLETPSEQ